MYALEGSGKQTVISPAVFIDAWAMQLVLQEVPSNGLHGDLIYKTRLTGSRLRDSMGFIKSASEINDLARSTPDSGGIYFVTAFSGLLAPYWDPGAAGLIIGMRTLTLLLCSLSEELTVNGV